MDYYDIADLAAELTESGLIFENDFTELEEKLYDKYEISFENFCKLIEDLIKFTPVIQTAITKDWCHAFVKELSNGICKIIVREEYESTNKN